MDYLNCVEDIRKFVSSIGFLKVIFSSALNVEREGNSRFSSNNTHQQIP
jgi:hypothetical protein